MRTYLEDSKKAPARRAIARAWGWTLNGMSCRTGPAISARISTVFTELLWDKAERGLVPAAFKPKSGTTVCSTPLVRVRSKGRRACRPLTVWGSFSLGSGDSDAKRGESPGQAKIMQRGVLMYGVAMP